MSWLGPKSSWREIQEEKKGKAKRGVCVRRKGTYWYEKLLDLLQSVTHPGVRLGWWGEDLNEDVQVFVQVVIFGLAALP